MRINNVWLFLLKKTLWTYIFFCLGCVVLKDNGKVEFSAPKDSFQFKSSIRGLTDQTHEFSFSRVFDDKTHQKELFDEIMLPFVKDILDGQNGLVFTYGVTNSGKVLTVSLVIFFVTSFVF